MNRARNTGFPALNAIFLILMLLAVTATASSAQEPPQQNDRPHPPASGPASGAPEDASSFSGEYEFLREGEVLQLTIQPDDAGTEKNVTGFISRHGDTDSDRGTMLDHWIHIGTLRGTELQFRTSTIHGVWFEFQGSIARGAGRSPHERGYHVIRGKLTRHVVDREGHDLVQSREVTLNSQPDEAPDESKQ